VSTLTNFLLLASDEETGASVNYGYSLREFASTLALFLDAINVKDKVVVVGNSLGGGIAETMAIHYPRQVSLRVSLCGVFFTA
jgi:pimeloyl-ACP methyl ester carboxylesterase